MFERNRSRLLCNLSGALLAALVLAFVFSAFGYSGGATWRDFAGEFAVAFVSFGAAVLFWHYASSRNNLWLDALTVCLLGALINAVLKVVILEGANGAAAYVRAASEGNSLTPIVDLVVHFLSVTMLATIISLLPFTIGAWLCRSGKQVSFRRGN